MLKSVIAVFSKDLEKNQAVIQVAVEWERNEGPLYVGGYVQHDFQVEVLGTTLKAYRTRLNDGQIWRVTQDGTTIKERVGDGAVFADPLLIVVPLDKLETASRQVLQ